jgi:hypothetical protein
MAAASGDQPLGELDLNGRLRISKVQDKERRDVQPALFHALPCRDHPDCLRTPRQPLPYVPTFAVGRGKAAQKDPRVQLEMNKYRREKGLGKLGGFSQGLSHGASF